MANSIDCRRSESDTKSEYEITYYHDPDDSNRDYRDEKPIPQWAQGDRLYRSLFFQQPALMCHLKTRLWPKKNSHYKLFTSRENRTGNFRNISFADFDRETFGSPLYREQMMLPIKM